jgi:predicted transcriptional regulator
MKIKDLNREIESISLNAKIDSLIDKDKKIPTKNGGFLNLTKYVITDGQDKCFLNIWNNQVNFKAGDEIEIVDAKVKYKKYSKSYEIDTKKTSSINLSTTKQVDLENKPVTYEDFKTAKFTTKPKEPVSNNTIDKLIDEFETISNNIVDITEKQMKLMDDKQNIISKFTVEEYEKKEQYDTATYIEAKIKLKLKNDNIYNNIDETIRKITIERKKLEVKKDTLKFKIELIGDTNDK